MKAPKSVQFVGSLGKALSAVKKEEKEPPLPLPAPPIV